MNFRELQEKHGQWAETNFPNAEKWEPLVGMQEELGELSHAFLKMHQGIRVNEDHEGKMVDAVGDILIYMADFCNRNGIDMQEALETTWAEVKERDWKNNKQDGQGCKTEEAVQAGQTEKFGSQYVWLRKSNQQGEAPEGKFVGVGRQVGELVEQKNRAYGNSFGKSGAVLRELYPCGIALDQYDDMLCVVRIVDKLFRIATDKAALGESPYRDIAGYGILGAVMFGD